MKRFNFYLTMLLLLGIAVGCNDEFDMPPIQVPTASLTPNTTIAELKERYWDDARNYIDTIKEDVVIHGWVTSNDESGNIYKSMYISDGTGSCTVNWPDQKTCSIKASKAGDHIPVTAEYSGDEVYKPATAETTVEVLTKRPITFKITKVTDTNGNESNLYASDYRDIGALKELADKGKFSIDDIPETVSYQKGFLSVFQQDNEESHQQWLDAIKHYTLQEMAALANNLINFTELYHKLMCLDESVGGLIDLAVITLEDGFQWLNRKSWYDPSRGGQYGKFGI